MKKLFILLFVIIIFSYSCEKYSYYNEVTITDTIHKPMIDSLYIGSIVK